MSNCKSRRGPVDLVWVLLFFLAVSPAVFAGGKKENKQTGANSSVKGTKTVIASTSWVAAIARCGGAENIRVLAPADLRHPPEYELKPSDLDAVSKADLIIYAGWEQFAKKLAETAGSAKVQTLTLTTTNDPEILKTEAGKVAAVLGTQEAYQAWIKGFDAFTEELRQDVQAAYPDRRAVVQRMQTPFVQWLGFAIIGEYGPAEPSPALILELVQTKPALVIDNYHGPSGQPIAEAAHAPYTELINFPGKDGTETIEDVFRYNAEVLIRAAR